MNYLLIAYKPSFEDYCRGCLMASYSSEFDVFQYPEETSKASIIEKMAGYRLADEFRRRPSATWELYLYENGVEVDWGNEVTAAFENLLKIEKDKRDQAAIEAQKKAQLETMTVYFGGDKPVMSVDDDAALRDWNINAIKNEYLPRWLNSGRSGWQWRLRSRNDDVATYELIDLC